MQPVKAVPAYRRGRLRPRALVLALSLAHGLAAYAQTPASTVASTVANAVAYPPALTLEAALESATTRNTAIQAAQASVEASTQSIVSAGQLPNPKLTAGIDTLPINGNQAFTIGQNILTMRRVGVEQEWVSSRKRALQSDLAGKMAEREQSGYLAQLAEVRERTASAWLDVTYAKRAVTLREALVEHMSHELAATEASYRGAKATATDVTQARLMRAQANDDLLKARQRFQTSLIALSRWTAVPVADVAGDPPALQSAVATLPVEQLRSVEPALIAAAADIHVADADEAVSASRRSPNWTWNVSYLQGGGNSRFVSVGVSIPLPIHRSSVEDRDIAGKADLATRARLTYEDTQRQVEADIQTLATTLASGRERIAGLQGALLPAADARVDLAVAAYRAGTGSLAETFAARRAQLDAQLQVLDLQREVALTWAQLEYQVVPPALAANP
ncbi:TolC family protein [Paraburkholderia bannensis]|uniref:TolC family protein n=1 Tax=Paraburkholderia bannensis TaxID=765414 RepID=UPI0005AA4AA2|nr:TolC family protein [Paraburkholderia bannensis]